MATPLPGVNLMALLRQLGDALRADVIEALSREALEELTEATLNVILGNIPSSPEQLRSLRHHKQDLLELTGAKTSETRRRELLQKGGLFRSVAHAANNVWRPQV